MCRILIIMKICWILDHSGIRSHRDLCEHRRKFNESDRYHFTGLSSDTSDDLVKSLARVDV